VIVQKRRTTSKEPIFIIKTTDRAQYGNLVDILDEMSITGARHYSLVKITPADLELVSQYQQAHGIAR
jgi:biopolymer transport protein ExbD